MQPERLEKAGDSLLRASRDTSISAGGTDCGCLTSGNGQGAMCVVPSDHVWDTGHSSHREEPMSIQVGGVCSEGGVLGLPPE